MKKFLVVLLTLAVVGGLFAQGLTLTGEIKTGVGVYSDFYTGKSNFVVGHDDPFEQSRWRITATAGGENYGLKFGLQGVVSANGTDNGDSSGSVVMFDNAYGWIELLNKTIKLRAGRTADKAWSTGGDKGWDYSRGDVFTVEVKPIEGLNVGLALKAYDPAGGNNGAWNGDYDPVFKDRWIPSTVGDVEDVFKGTVIGASYNSDLFGISATVDLDGSSDAGHIARIPGRSATKDRDRDDMTSFIFGINLKMIENLTAIIEGNVAINSAAKNNGVWLTQKVEYAINPQFSAGLVAYEMFAFGDNARDKVPLLFKPYGSFALNDSMSVGAEFFLAINAQGDDFDAQGNKNRDPNSVFALDIKPKFTYKVNKLTVEIFDRINNIGADDTKTKGYLSNRFGVNFLVTF